MSPPRRCDGRSEAAAAHLGRHRGRGTNGVGRVLVPGRRLADITRALSEERVNILSATVTTTRDRIAVSRFSFEMADPKHLGHLLNAVRNVEGVMDAYRVTSGA